MAGRNILSNMGFSKGVIRISVALKSMLILGTITGDNSSIAGSPEGSLLFSSHAIRLRRESNSAKSIEEWKKDIETRPWVLKNLNDDDIQGGTYFDLVMDVVKTEVATIDLIEDVNYSTDKYAKNDLTEDQYFEVAKILINRKHEPSYELPHVQKRLTEKHFWELAETTVIRRPSNLAHIQLGKKNCNTGNQYKRYVNLAAKVMTEKNPWAFEGASRRCLILGDNDESRLLKTTYKSLATIAVKAHPENMEYVDIKKLMDINAYFEIAMIAIEHPWCADNSITFQNPSVLETVWNQIDQLEKPADTMKNEKYLELVWMAVEVYGPNIERVPEELQDDATLIQKALKSKGWTFPEELELAEELRAKLANSQIWQQSTKFKKFAGEDIPEEIPEEINSGEVIDNFKVESESSGSSVWDDESETQNGDHDTGVEDQSTAQSGSGQSGTQQNANGDQHSPNQKISRTGTNLSSNEDRNNDENQDEHYQADQSVSGQHGKENQVHQFLSEGQQDIQKDIDPSDSQSESGSFLSISHKQWRNLGYLLLIVMLPFLLMMALRSCC